MREKESRAPTHILTNTHSSTSAPIRPTHSAFSNGILSYARQADDEDDAGVVVFSADFPWVGRANPKIMYVRMFGWVCVLAGVR